MQSKGKESQEVSLVNSQKDFWNKTIYMIHMVPTEHVGIIRRILGFVPVKEDPNRKPIKTVKVKTLIGFVFAVLFTIVALGEFGLYI